MNTEQRAQIQGIVDQMKGIEKEIRVIEKANQKTLDQMPTNLKTKSVIKKTEYKLDLLDEAAVYVHDIGYVLRKVIK